MILETKYLFSHQRAKKVYKFNKCLEFSGMMITNEVLALKVTRRGAYTKSERKLEMLGGWGWGWGITLMDCIYF